MQGQLETGWPCLNALFIFKTDPNGMTSVPKVVRLRPCAQPVAENRMSALIAGFAENRRLPDDVFWLKENAELLGILRACDIPLGADALAPFEAFYDQIQPRMKFFPQYYRFLLSICLDLEDLGMGKHQGAALCAWVGAEGLAEVELSDLQRAEARRLLVRRGVCIAADDSLDARLHAFVERSATFALPNKKAAYELTHIVFYLSEYGQRDPELSAKAMVSLEYAGLLAYLDQNADLLAEVCIAMRFAGAMPSPLWEGFVADQHRAIRIMSEPDAPMNDAYHAYLVTGWALHAAGQDNFQAPVKPGALRFAPSVVSPQGALRTMSERMYELGNMRSGDWEKMRAQVMPYLGNTGQQILTQAEQSSDCFEGFFAGFARAV